MRIVGLYIFFLLFNSISNAQVFTYQAVYGGKLYDTGIKSFLMADGGLMVFANTSSFGEGNTDMYIIRTDSTGKPLWQKTLGTAEVDEIRDVVDLPFGFVACGFSNRNIGNGYDVWVVAVDTAGELLWERTYGGADWDLAYSLTLDSAGYIVVGGQTALEGNYDFYMLKLNQSGDTIWTKTYGASLFAEGITASLTLNSQKYLFAGTRTYSDKKDDIVYLMTDTAGNSLWEKEYGDNWNDRINQLALHPSGLIYGCGFWGKDSLVEKGLLLITDTLGNVAYTCPSYYWSEEVDFFLNAIKIHPSGYIDVCGFTEKYGNGRGDFMIYRLLYPCETIKGQTMGGSDKDWVNNLIYGTQGSFIMTGTTESYGNLFHSVYVVKSDSVYYSNPNALDYTIGLNENRLPESVLIYPNPVFKNLNILLSEEIKHFNYSIMDIAARIVKSGEGENNTASLNIQQIPQGIYFLEIKSEKLNTIIKLIKL